MKVIKENFNNSIKKSGTKEDDNTFLQPGKRNGKGHFINPYAGSTQSNARNAVASFDNAALDDPDEHLAPLVAMADMDDDISDAEQYRQYVGSRLSVNETRALYQRMLAGMNGSYANSLSNKLQINLSAAGNTFTLDEEVLGPKHPSEIKCSTCPSGWEDLIKFKPPQEIYDRFNNENETAPFSVPVGIWYVHEMENALGDQINLDEYSMQVNILPEKSDGNQMSMEELFTYFRLHLDDLISHSVSRFGDYPGDEDVAHTDNWETDNYYGVVKVFRAFGTFMGVPVFDDLGVIATKQDYNSWIFSTIHTPATNNHAVSGNREFGYTSNGNGSYTFFIRGADVATGIIDVQKDEDIFDGAELLWNSVMDNLMLFINNNGGSANGKVVVSDRYNLEK